MASTRLDAYEIKHARINATADGDNTVISAVAGKTIVVIGYALTATVAGVVTVKSGASTVLSSSSLAANGGVSYAGGTNAPAFATAKGEALVVNTVATQDVLGHVSYVEV